MLSAPICPSLCAPDQFLQEQEVSVVEPRGALLVQGGAEVVERHGLVREGHLPNLGPGLPSAPCGRPGSHSGTRHISVAQAVYTRPDNLDIHSPAYDRGHHREKPMSPGRSK